MILSVLLHRTIRELSKRIYVGFPRNKMVNNANYNRRIAFELPMIQVRLSTFTFKNYAFLLEDNVLRFFFIRKTFNLNNDCIVLTLNFNITRWLQLLAFIIPCCLSHDLHLYLLSVYVSIVFLQCFSFAIHVLCRAECNKITCLTNSPTYRNPNRKHKNSSYRRSAEAWTCRILLFSFPWLHICSHFFFF